MYENLFKPIRLGPVDVKNRIVMPPMCTHFATYEGEVTDRLIAYFVERAKGGTGLILPGYTYIDDRLGRSSHTQLGVYSDDLVPGLRRLADAVKEAGARIFLQIVHGGRQADGESGETVAPSPVPIPGQKPPRELTVPEIEEIIEMFGKAADRAKRAGFDGVELHGAHGYLITQFLSDYTNRRSDEYGGDQARRNKFLLDVIAKVREYVGDDFPIGLRISGDEYLKFKGKEYAGRGITAPVAQEISRAAEAAGVCYIHVSAAIGETADAAQQPIYYPRGMNVHLAQAVKQAVDIPVIAVGSITTPEQADEIIAQGKADMVAFGRALIADPYLPRKAEEGRREDIRVCIRCSQCTNPAREPYHVRCTVNFDVGREMEPGERPAERAKKVLVVGGGPGGMEASLVAARRGHQVILCEKSDHPGGHLLPASAPPFKEDLKSLLDYYETHLPRLGVEVRLRTNVDKQTVKDLSPDVVVLAMGSRPVVPEIPGVGGSNVFSALDVLVNPSLVAGEEVVVLGGGMVGCETALLLAMGGKQVTVVEMLPQVLQDEEISSSRTALLRRLAEVNVELCTGFEATQITDDGVVAKGRRFAADAVVLAMGLEAENHLLQELRGEWEVHAIGDCVQPRRFYHALQEATEIARAL